MIHRRVVGLPVVIVLALLSALLLAPSGGTHALWSDGRTQPLGSVSSDSIGLSASRVSAEPATLPGAATVEIHNNSARLSGTVSASPMVTPVGRDSGLAGQVDVSYAECASGAEIGASPLGPGERQELCVRATTPGFGADFLRKHAGVTVQVSSQLIQTAVDVPAWSSSATVDTQHRVTFPRPTHPGRTLRLANVCQGSLLGPATLSWAWPDTSGSRPVGTPAVDRWVVQQKVGNDWLDIVTINDGSARSAKVPEAALLGLLDTSWVRVVGYPAAEPATPVVGTFQVRVTKILDLLGLSVLVTCGKAEPL